jgi:TRAP-type C4-dicarboxylate transport system permease small subunit
MRAVTSEIPTPPPTLPRRGPLLLAFLGVVLAGTFGAFIGYGLADLSSTTHATTTNLLGALIGAVICAGGVGVVAVLTLRAMAEWKQHPADRPSAPTAEPDAPSPRG